MSGCGAFPWCIRPAGHVEEGTGHYRPVLAVETRAQAVKVEVAMVGDAEWEHVDLFVEDRWTGLPIRRRFEIAEELAGALGALILALSADDTLKLGEALLLAGTTLREGRP